MDPKSRSRRTLGILLPALFFAAVFLLLFNEAMVRGLGHDEHQFIASGRLLADHGLLPYRDYPYFHMPYLAVLYALAFKISDYSFLAARLVSVLAALASLGLIFYLLHRQFQSSPGLTRWAVPAAAVWLLVANPIFSYTSGQAWNHDVGELLVLLAFLACQRSSVGSQPRWGYVIAGSCLGLAIGVRLSYVLAGAAFVVWMGWRLVRTSPAERSWKPVMGLGVGGALALLPALVLFLLAPRDFIFGNLVYPELNTLFRLETGFRSRMDWAGKLVYLVRDVILTPGTLSLVLVCAALVAAAWAFGRRSRNAASGALDLALLLGGALIVSAWLPSPTWLQYYFAPIPFLVLAAGIGLSRLRDLRGVFQPALGLWFLATGVSVFFGTRSYPSLAHLVRPDRWATVQVHRIGEALARETEPGKILTLAPIYPLEGGRLIYAHLATGPFAWRTAHLVGEAERAGLGLVSPRELAGLFGADPPAGVLVGPEGELEQPIRDYAEARHFRTLVLDSGLELLVPP